MAVNRFFWSTRMRGAAGRPRPWPINTEVKQQFIYVIAPEGTGASPCKIGISTNPDRRLRQLQTGFPHRLRVHHREAVDDDKARLLERLLHRDIGHLRQSGEWFDIAVDEAIGHVKFTVIHYHDEPDLRWKMMDRRI